MPADLASPPSSASGALRSTGARTRVVLAWLLPSGLLAVALLWLLPFASRSAAAPPLVDQAPGSWAVLGILLVWAVSLAAFATYGERRRRPATRAWTAVQVVLLLAVLTWALPPLLLAAPPPVALTVSWTAHFVLPTAAMILSAVQAVLLFFSA
ncbi:hypothetical protein QDR37_01575 [Amnibacterium sp. CER49]|uniref:hypothetical protein n=1 Tax=Amnibacterium sp. CER49 TaxID=3039161 RepID=UPI002446F800|nr:hypothetical protein [Amnibacterium sp. CER49]MDH2442625.1 hypothetical protein [Amnibacterium sp. CER49]